MPHIIVEYSANVETALKLPELLDSLHDAALRTGVFPIGGLRTRAARRDHYRIADRHAQNAFVHVVLRIGHGRELETRKRAAETVFDALCAHLQPVFASQPLGLSLELQEIDPVLSFKRNNLHDYVSRRQAEESAAQ